MRRSQVERELLARVVARGEAHVEADGARAETRAKVGDDGGGGVVQLAEVHLDDVVAARRFGAVVVDVLQVLPAASVLRAVAIELKARRRRARVTVGHALLRWRHQDKVHLGAARPRQRELQHPRRHAAPLVDDAIAVVVDRVEAKLRPRGRTRLHERRPAGPFDVRRDDRRPYGRDRRRPRPAPGGDHRIDRRRDSGPQCAGPPGAPPETGAFAYSGTPWPDAFGFITSKNARRARSPVTPGSVRSAISTPFSLVNLRMLIASARFTSLLPLASA